MNIEEFIEGFKDQCNNLDFTSQEVAFVEEFSDYLLSNGIISDYELCYRYMDNIGLKVNGYSYSPEEILTIIVADFDVLEYGKTISKTNIQRSYKRACKYIEKSLKGFKNMIEDTSEDYPLAQLIEELNYKKTDIKIVILTNKIYKTNAILDKISVQGKEISYDIWDIERLYQLVNENQGITTVNVDFNQMMGKPLSLLKVDNNSVEFDCYIGSISGTVLADIYEKWGQRLIERNVRSYLQARGNVNKGIKNTLKSEQEMFIAYNNGISTVAEKVHFNQVSGDLFQIESVEGLQVVNGGQTTASMYYTRREDKVTLDNVNVQIKLTVIKSNERMNEMTSKISEYANTQNKISLSDLKANHYSLIELETISRKHTIPNKAGIKSIEHWFFERARGQYLVDLSREHTQNKRDKFKNENPKDKILTKTDVAKYYMTWIGYPHKVSKGGEANFKDFIQYLDDKKVDNKFFKELIATAILFRKCDELVKNHGYPGYKINIVTYSVAALAFMYKKEINLNEIWDNQEVDTQTIDKLNSIIPNTWSHINSPPIQGANISSWCKKEECWTSYQKKIKKVKTYY